MLVIPTIADPPLALNVKKRLCGDFYDRAHALLSISSMSGCCQVKFMSFVELSSYTLSSLLHC